MNERKIDEENMTNKQKYDPPTKYDPSKFRFYRQWPLLLNFPDAGCNGEFDGHLTSFLCVYEDDDDVSKRVILCDNDTLLKYDDAGLEVELFCLFCNAMDGD